MIIYEINTDFFKKCLRVVSKDATRYNTSGVFIHDDKEGVRHYVGTNGHILVHCKEKFEGPTLEKGIIIRPTAALGTRKCCRYVPMKVYDEQTGQTRFDKMKVTHPQLYDYIMHKLNGEHVLNEYLKCDSKHQEPTMF